MVEKADRMKKVVSQTTLTSKKIKLNPNFAYSNCWSNRITDSFEIEEFERAFKSITQYFQSARSK